MDMAQVITDEPLNIHDARIRAGLSIKELSIKAKVAEIDIRKWERGLELPKPKNLLALSNCLNISIENILKAQNELSIGKTPGEGYSTSKAAKGTITYRKYDPPNKIKLLDIFCGSGGLSFGFEQTDQYVTIGGIDLLADRIKTFTSNHQYANAIAGNILSYSVDEIKEIVGSVDIVVGGPPCQGFSSIRPFRNLTEGDPRNSLVEHYVLVINKIKPKWFVFENVVGILRHENGERLTSLLNGLKASGYSVSWKIIKFSILGCSPVS